MARTGMARGQDADPTSEVQVRITDALAGLLSNRSGASGATPAAYVRRHLVEHAAAGGVLDERILTPRFLPYVDAPRLRGLTPTWHTSAGVALWRAWRHIAHAWRWDCPAANLDALAFTLAAWDQTGSAPPDLMTAVSSDRVWLTRWARQPRQVSEILARGTGGVFAVAAVTLPDGRPVAVIAGGFDGTVRVWDLTA
ncbi:hypothetical protein, partial [Dactylosporangium sp. NPDC048998]|uniref:hypothetical protein n=1 Tax=Dactylosporangium sp. NPDC048998 TaxID=3363976 RepID=UPI003722E1C6